MSRTTIAITLAVAIVTGCGGRTAQQQTAIGQTHLVLGNIDEAAKAFRSAIKADDSNAHAHLGLARCLFLKDDPQRALDSYLRAAASPDAVVASCFEAADIVLHSNNPARADEWAQRLSAIDPESGAILTAYLMRQAGDVKGAEAVLEKAREDFGSASDAALELAWLYAMQQDSDRALARYETLAETSANAASVAMLAAELRALDANVAQKTKSDVANAWEAARRKSYDAARRGAEPFATGPNATPWANVVLGYCALSQGAPREAERLLRLASYELPASSIVRDLLTEAHGPLAKPDAAGQTQAAMTPGAWQALWNAGRLRPFLDDRTKWGEPEEIGDAQYVAALVVGNAGLAVAFAENLTPGAWLKPFAAAMNTAVQQGQPSDLLELIADWSPQTDDDIVLMRNASARAYAVAQLRARALEQILRCLVEAPENSVALYNLATLYREAGMPSHELEAWRRLLARHPEHEEAQARVYALLIQQRRFAEARRAAEAAYVSNPDDPVSLVRLADASFKTDDTDFALAALIKNARTRPEDRIAVRALTRGYLVLGEGNNAVAALEGHADEHDLHAFALTLTGAWDDALAASTAGSDVPLLHAALLTRSGEYDDAQSILNRTALTRPARIWADALLGRADAGVGVGGLALALGSRADVLADFALGAAYSAGGLAKPALERWQIVSAAIDFDAELSTLMLVELARTGAIPDKALQAERLVERHDESPQVWLAFADVHASLENNSAKFEALTHAANLADDSTEVWQAIAQRVDESDTELMLESFRNLYRLSPDDPLVQNNLAYALLQSGESKPDPLPLAESAFAALGARSHVLHTLGLAFARAGRIDDAREKLYQALEQRPGDPTLMLDFGKALIAQGETEEGRGLVETSLRYADRLRVTFPRRNEAESILAEEAV